MPLHKIPVLVTVLVEADTPSGAHAHVSSLRLSQIAELIDSGEGVGRVVVQEAEQIPPALVAAELEAVGSDASFFGNDDEDAA